MRDPDTVAGIVSALREVHGDGVTRLLLNDGLTLAHCNAIVTPPTAAESSTPTLPPDNCRTTPLWF